MRKKRSTASRRCLPGLHLGKPQAPSGPAEMPQHRGPKRRARVRRAEAVTFARAAPSGHGPGRPPPRRCAPEPRNGAILPTAVARRRRGESAIGKRRPTHRPRERGRGAQGARLPHSPRRSLAARARTPPRPGAPSAAAAGEEERVKFTPGATPASLPRAPPARRADPLPHPRKVRVGAKAPPPAPNQRPLPGRPAREPRARGARNT